MALPPSAGIIRDPAIERAIRELRNRFPIHAKDVAEDVATQAEIDAIIAGGVTFGTPGTIQPDDTAAEGVASASARSDHRHAIATAPASTLSGSNAEGSSTSFARADHNHALGGSVGGVLSGTLPNPSFAADMATQAELDSEASTRASGDTAAIAHAIQRTNHTGTQLASTVSNFDTQVRTSRLDQMAAPTSDVSANSHKLVNVADGSNSLDAVNYSQLLAASEAAAAGLSIKSTVRVASTVNVAPDTASALVLTGTGSLTVDGVALATDDRVLLKNQTTGSQNGVWVYAESGTDFGGSGNFGGSGTFGDPGATWSLTRATDADEASEFPGMFVPVGNEGTANKKTAWILTTTGAITVGTTSLAYAQFTAAPVGSAGGALDGSYPNPGLASSVAGDGLTETSDVLAVGAGHGLDVTANAVDVDETELTVGGDLTGTVANAQIGAAAVGTTEAPTFVNSTVENLKVIRGVVNTTTTTPVEGAGFTLTDSGVGDMTINFSAAFSDVPAVVCEVAYLDGGSSAYHAVLLAATASTARVGLNTFAGSAAEGIFHFIAVGPR